MSKNNYIHSTFEKGLNLDSTPNTHIPGTYSYALNAVNRDLNSFNVFGNEPSNRLFCDLGSEIIGHGYLDERNKYVVFTREGIYLVDKKGKKEFVANDSEFNCNWNLASCNWITPEFKTLDPCSETIVYWSSGCEYFKLNIDEMLDATRKASLKEAMKETKNQCSDITCEYFKVFKLSCAPKISPVAYQSGGSGLKCGAYQFAVRLKNNEGSYTNWFTITDPVYIGSEHNQAGEQSNGYIEVNLSALDCNYDSGELAVIETINGNKNAKLVTQFNYVNDNYSYTFTGLEGDVISIDEIITKGNTYLQGQDLVQYNGNMFYFNIRQKKNINYQPRANNIKTNYYKYRVPYEIAKRYNLKSFMRGESYGFGIKLNSSDGRSTRVFHIPAIGQTVAGENATSVAPDEVPTGTVGFTRTAKYERGRNPLPDSVNDPQFDEYTDTLKTNVENITTNISDVCDVISECDDCEPAAEACNNDTPDVDATFSAYGDILSDYGQNNPNDLDVDYSSSNLKDAANKINDSVDNRERTKNVGAKYFVDKGGAPVTMSNDTTRINLSSVMAGLYFDAHGVPEIEIQIDRVNLGPSIPRLEKDILYPDTKDCEGEYIYGVLANTPVRHHQVPWGSAVPHYVSNSIGVPSAATPDADEYKNSYVDIIGVSFADIELPTEEELGFKLCERNPYTILQIPRNSKNRTIHSKGILSNTILSTNDGRQYLYPTHGLNSEDSTVNRYIKIGDSRLDAGATMQRHFNFWSLDTMIKAHALNFNFIKVEGIVSGIGHRHNLYAEGFEPDNSLYSSRIDQRGTRQAINLNKFTPQEKYEEVGYKIYAPANEVVSPPFGAPHSLMNKYQQESVWLGVEELDPLIDKSFKGDVLNHSAPISEAQTYYVALVNELPNQYGDLTNMVYTPILEAGFNNTSRIEGICGDTFIGFHSFVRTSYVSDKVGDKFPISNMVPGKSDRCICDSPEDAIHSLNGKWSPTTLPKDGDAADAKNWAGLHTDGTSHSWVQSNAEVPISDYYYPKTLKTLITYCGEFEVNPYMRQRGDALEDQVYKNMSSEYGLDSSIESNSGAGWDDDYLNQFYWEVEQPSRWMVIRKALIRTLLATIFPLFDLAFIMDFSSFPEMVKSLGISGIAIAIWFQMLKVLYTNKYLDELFGIPVCKTDEEGGEKDLHITNFFHNYSRYNRDLSKQNDLEPFYGLPNPYYTCDCSDCDDFTTDEIYISDEQKQGSYFDAYSMVRPNNKINIPANKGRLIDMFINGTNLWAQTTEQLVPLRYGKVSQSTSIGDIIIGHGPILDKPIGLAEGVYEGSLGLLSRQHAINTKYGRVFLDYNAAKLYIFRDTITEVSLAGAYNHFKRNLKYRSPSECENEHLHGNDIALGIDPRTDRLLITKRGQGDDNWTISYDMLYNQWISFHSYIPHFYIWDRESMITSDGTKLWIHDINCNFQTFMDKYHPHILEFNINDNDIDHEVFKSGLLYTMASKCSKATLNLLDRDITFNKIWARNNRQTTGFLDIAPITPRNELHEDTEYKSSDKPIVTVNKVDVHWRYNELVDNTADTEDAMFIMSKNGIEPIPTNVRIGNESDTFKNNIHLNNYLYMQFIFDKFDDYKLYTHSHLTLVNKNEEFYG